MTLSQLLDCSADELAKLSDAQLLEHFKPYLDVTRPERARLMKPKPQHEPAVFVSPGKKRALESLAKMGLDMDLFRKKGKKK